MMLRITKTYENADHVQFLLEGKVTQQWATLLDGVCRAHLLDNKAIQLDCADVDFIDARGVEVLRSFPRKQVTLVRAPGFVTELLQLGVKP